MKSKIKIINWFKEYHFYEIEKGPRYYFGVEITYRNRAKFILHNKIILYVLGLLSAIAFSFFYYNDIKLFTYVSNILGINNNDVFFSNEIIENCIVILDKIIHNKYVLFGLILLIIFIIIFLKYDYKTAYQLIIKIIYRRINYILNLSFFLIWLEISIVDYFEYNFFYLIIICLFIIKDIIKSIYYRRLCLDSFFCHFLSIPYFLIIVAFLLLITHSVYFYPIFSYVLFLNQKFFTISDYHEINKPNEK